MEATKQLILRLPPEIHKALKMISVVKDKTMTEIVIEWIKREVGKGDIPTRDFTDEEIREMMDNQAKAEKENPELMKWARDRVKEKSE